MPDRSRLKILEKVPPPIIATRGPMRQQKSPLLTRGPETLHNTIIYGEYGVQVGSLSLFSYDSFIFYLYLLILLFTKVIGI